PAATEAARRTRINSCANATVEREKRFDWPLCYDAERFVLEQIDAFLARNTFAANLAKRMRAQTGTLIIDWVDHLVLSEGAEPTLRKVGFANDPLGQTSTPTQSTFWHSEAMLPRAILDRTLPKTAQPQALAIRVESLSDFMAAHRITGEPEGGPRSRFRRLLVSSENQTRFEAVERRGYRGCVPENVRPEQTDVVLKAHELWKTRQRIFADDTEGFRHAHAVLDRVIALVGRDLACHVVFAEERAYWEQRNRAAQIQKRRQDKLGL